jgi:hypothetical protein
MISVVIFQKVKKMMAEPTGAAMVRNLVLALEAIIGSTSSKKRSGLRIV